MQVINKIFRLLFQVYISILSSIPTEIGIKLRYLVYKPLFKSNKGNFRIDSGVTISSFKNIDIGKNIRFEKNSYVYAINANVKLGDNFFLGNNSQISASREDIYIGNNCMIAPYCILVSDNHRFDNSAIPIMQQGYIKGKIVIEDDVWIGSHSVILKDVTIGKGSVIGAGSVVTKNVKPHSIVGGVPATLIRMRK